MMKITLLSIMSLLSACNAQSYNDDCDTSVVSNLYSQFGEPATVSVHAFDVINAESVTYDWPVQSHQVSVLISDSFCDVSHFHGVDY